MTIIITTYAAGEWEVGRLPHSTVHSKSADKDLI